MRFLWTLGLGVLLCLSLYFQLMQSFNSRLYWNVSPVITENINAPVINSNPITIDSRCTRDDDHRSRPQPKDVEGLQYNRVRQGEEIASYIVTGLHKVDAPVTLLFGSTLHEYRNGTGTCIHPYFLENDLDMGVFREHFHYVVLLLDEIEKKFQWYVDYIAKDAFISIYPPGQKGKRKNGEGFQIDVYSFAVNQPRIGLVEFVWDDVRVASDAFIPLVKHKQVVSSKKDNVANSSIPYFYMPFNSSCYLENLYGADFMTPKKNFQQKKFNVKPKEEMLGKFDKFDNPRCDRVLSVSQQHELERQMSFANQTYEGNNAADSIFLAMTKKKKGK